jgi:hypothetical protein
MLFKKLYECVKSLFVFVLVGLVYLQNSPSPEIRMFFSTSVYSVFFTELPEFRGIMRNSVSRNLTKFRGIQWFLVYVNSTYLRSKGAHMYIYVWNYFFLLFSVWMDSFTRFFVSGFFPKQLLLVPLDTLRKNFYFNKITKKFFEFKGNSPVYLQLGSHDIVVYSPPGSFALRGSRLPGLFFTG